MWVLLHRKFRNVHQIVTVARAIITLATSIEALQKLPCPCHTRSYLLFRDEYIMPVRGVTTILTEMQVMQPC